MALAMPCLLGCFSGFEKDKIQNEQVIWNDRWQASIKFITKAWRLPIATTLIQFIVLKNQLFYALISWNKVTIYHLLQSLFLIWKLGFYLITLIKVLLSRHFRKNPYQKGSPQFLSQCWQWQHWVEQGPCATGAVHVPRASSHCPPQQRVPGARGITELGYLLSSSYGARAWHKQTEWQLKGCTFRGKMFGCADSCHILAPPHLFCVVSVLTVCYGLQQYRTKQFPSPAAGRTHLRQFCSFLITICLSCKRNVTESDQDRAGDDRRAIGNKWPCPTEGHSQ